METTDYVTTDYATYGASGDPGINWIMWLIIWALSVVAFWRVFEKAGQPSWAALIPVYNMYILLKIAGRPGWWLILLFIPLVNVIVSLVVALDMAKAFGKSTLFGVVGLWLFNLIGYLILGFGDAKYVGKKI